MSFWRTMAIAWPLSYLILSIADAELFTAHWWTIMVPLIILNFGIFHLSDKLKALEADHDHNH